MNPEGASLKTRGGLLCSSLGKIPSLGNLSLFLRFLTDWMRPTNVMEYKMIYSKATIEMLLLFSHSISPLCKCMDSSTPGFPVFHYLPEFPQTHVLWVSDTIQPSHPLPSPSPTAFSLSQHQGLFQWVASSHQAAKMLQIQSQHQSFQWIFRTDFLWNQDWMVWPPYCPRDSQESSIQVQKHQFFGAQPSLWSNLHISTWLLEKP